MLRAAGRRVPRKRSWLTRQLSTVRAVRSTADRELALPLAFLSLRSSRNSAPAPSNPWLNWAERFASRGYSSLLLDVDLDAANSATTSQALLDMLEQELLKLLRDPDAASPFPSLLFGASHASLLAETYVSSHPLSALCLVSPTPAPVAHTLAPQMFPSTLSDFDYEPGFPIAVLEDPASHDPKRALHRLVRDFVDEDDDEGLVRRLEGRQDEEGWQRVMEWMDENGL